MRAAKKVDRKAGHFLKNNTSNSFSERNQTFDLGWNNQPGLKNQSKLN